MCAIWSRTKSELQRLIESSVRSGRKNVATLTANDRFTIFNAINEAIVDIAIERGIDAPTPIVTDTTATTTASTNYVDLDSAVIGVKDGTVRIVAHDQILSRFEGAMESFYAGDPGEDVSSSWPRWYCLGTNGSGAFRMFFRNIPDAAYTINLNVETMPDEDSVSSFPGWYHGALRSLATSIALENLGLPIGTHQQRYADRMKNIANKARGYDGPIHIPMRTSTVRKIDFQART